jgi:hypothetical protein
MPVIVVAVTGAATHFGRLAIHQRDDGMIRQPAAFNAEIVDDIAQPQLTHPNWEYITIADPATTS